MSRRLRRSSSGSRGCTPSVARYPSRRMKSVLLARLGRNPGLEVAGKLAGGEHEIADHERFVVVGQGARNGRGDNLVLEAFARHIAAEIDLDQRVLHQQPGAADRGAWR